MTLNKWAGTRIEQRRQHVAELRLRGLSMAGVAETLAEEYGIVNPRSKKPYTAVTVHNDLKVIHARWKESAERDIAEHKARQAAELELVKKAAWEKGDYEGVRRALETEMKLLGTKAPERIRHDMPDVENLRVVLELPIKGSGWEVVDGRQIEGPAGETAAVPQLDG
jgi:hypothetical protein